MSEADLYAGREQTLVKHFILRNYLDRFAHIVGSAWNAITYVDCFSGPWKPQSASLDDTSFSIALNELRKARAHLREGLGKDFDLRCFFLEKDAEAFQQLREFAQSFSDAEIVTVNAPLEASVEAVLAFVSRRKQDSFPFIFIDPTGWTGFALDVIAPLLRLTPGEVIVNFMTSHIMRFAEHPDPAIRQSFDRLFGPIDYRARITSLTGQDREDELVRCYRDAIQLTGKFEYVCTAFVLNRENDRTHFNLLYATRSSKGLDAFKQVEEKAMSFMQAARGEAQKRGRETRTRQQEMAFTNETSGEHYDALRQRYIERARQRVQDMLRSKRVVSFDHACDAALSEPLVWKSDLEHWLSEWKKSGSVDIVGLKPKERKPKRRAGHDLVWKGEQK